MQEIKDTDKIEIKDADKIEPSDIVMTIPGASVKIESRDTVTKEIGVAAKPESSAAIKDEPGGIAQSFAGLPIEHLICDPIIAVAKGQQKLCEVYLDTINKLAYETEDQTPQGGQNPTKSTRILSFLLDRPVPDGKGGYGTQQIKVNAPLLSLVPIPAFTMDEIDIRFTMIVKDQCEDKSTLEAKASVDVGVDHWGFTSKITGSVTSNSSHTRTTDQSATYDIHARAIQHPPVEGMAKLTSLFASVMEPLPTQKSS